MKNNFKFYIYVIILVLFASVVWIKYDYDTSKVKNVNNDDNTLFMNFIEEHNISYTTFSCPAKNETIIYLDDEYLLTSLGELYEVKYNSLFENGYNCRKVEKDEAFKGFYNNNKIIYDDKYNFYDINNNFDIYDIELSNYYRDDLTNLNSIEKRYPYIYVYDVEAKSINLDSSLSSNKLLIDNKGNINIYTNYGYPSAFNLIISDDTEIIFDRLDYRGVVLSIARSTNNELLDIERLKYINSLMEIPKELYGIRMITTKGLYNEVINKECNEKLCDTVLKFDEEFSKYFDNIVYSNGKYIFTKDNPTTIYNIENYITSK